MEFAAPTNHILSFKKSTSLTNSFTNWIIFIWELIEEFLFIVGLNSPIEELLVSWNCLFETFQYSFEKELGTTSKYKQWNEEIWVVFFY